MSALLLIAVLGSSDPLRKIVADTALQQAKKPEPAWHPEQRDCAGLVRFAYRRAFNTLQPSRVGEGLWRDDRGQRQSFADAETLIRNSFTSLGRGSDARDKAQLADVLAFRTDADEPSYHLMLLVRGEDSARAEPLVVYSPGDGSSEVRVGTLHSLETQAPVEWRPLPSNPRFLGYFRYTPWVDDERGGQ